MRVVRERLAIATSKATEELRLGNRTALALQALLKCKELSLIMFAIQSLEVSTRLWPESCLRVLERGGLPVLVALVQSCNRSEPHQLVLKLSLAVLVNLGAAPRGRAALGALGAGFLEVLVDLLQMYRGNKEITALAANLLCGILTIPALLSELRARPSLEKRVVMICQVAENKQDIETHQVRLGFVARKPSADPVPAVPPHLAATRALRKLVTK